MSPAIEISALGKRYLIEQGARVSYQTLREAVPAGFRRMWAPSRQTEEFWALKGVSFQVMPGEVLGIVGRNGAGKSTLLKILSRVTKPTTGEAIIRGRMSSLLEVGTGFHPELTGRENLYLSGAILGMSRQEIRRKFDEIVEFAEIGKFLDTAVKRYSSGMYVRLAFSVAAHLDPEILIVDEVLAVGDAKFQKKCLGKLSDVSAKEGRTALFVSHNLNTIRTLCARSVLLEKGEVKMVGPSHEVVSAYLDNLSNISRGQIPLDEIVRQEPFGTRVRIVSFELNPGKPILHGHPLVARIQIRTSSAISNLAIGFALCSLDGNRVITLHSDYGGELFEFPAGFCGTVEARIPRVDLSPGNYSVDVGAHTVPHLTMDYLPGCGQVEIVAGDDTPPEILRGSVGVFPKSQWTVERVTDIP